MNENGTSTALAVVDEAAPVVPMRPAAGIQLAPGVVVSIGDARSLAMELCQSATLPDYIKKPGDVLAAMLKASQWGLPLMAVIEGCACIKGKMSPTAHLLKAVVFNSGMVEKWSVDSQATGCKIVVKRRGHEERPYTFTRADAEAAGLLSSDMYRKYPRQMYEARATTLAARGEFPDLLAGAYSQDELAPEQQSWDSEPTAADTTIEAECERTSTDDHTRRTLYALSGRIDQEQSAEDFRAATQELLEALACAHRDGLMHVGGETDEAARAALYMGLFGGYASAESDEAVAKVTRQTASAKSGGFVTAVQLKDLKRAREEAVARLAEVPADAQTEE